MNQKRIAFALFYPVLGLLTAPILSAQDDDETEFSSVDVTEPQKQETPNESKSTDLKLSQDQMMKIFDGDLASLDLDPEFEPLRYGQATSGFSVPQPHPNIGKRQGPQPKKAPETCLAIAVAEVEKQISKQKQALIAAEEEDEKAELLRRLGESYQLRFELDTAFQDYKVSEIERRAKKLREDVEARQKATQQWVDAMVTLAKMKADGIETMNVPGPVHAPYYPSAATPAYAPTFRPNKSPYDSDGFQPLPPAGSGGTLQPSSRSTKRPKPN